MTDKNQKSQIIGNIEPYKLEDKVDEWIELLENFLSVNKITEDKEKMSWLILYGGKHIYAKIKVICAPDLPAEAKYAETKKKLISLLTPKHDVAVCRQNFYTRVQLQGETVQEYAMMLKELAGLCDFGSNLDPILRDRFIYNLSNEKVRIKTIEALKTTFQEAVSEARIHETSQISRQSGFVSRFQAESQSAALQRRGHQGGYARSSASKGRDINLTVCTTCGKPQNHGKYKCPAVYYNWECYKCGSYGHVAKVCKNKRRRINELEEEDVTNPTTHRQNATHDNDLGTLMDMADGKLEQINLIIESKPPLLHKFLFNKQSILCEIDTGACISVIPKKVKDKYFEEIELQKVTGTKFFNADGRPCAILGVIDLVVNEVFKVQAVVVDSEKKQFPLIGRNIIDLVYPRWREYFLLQNVSEVESSVAKKEASEESIHEIVKSFENEFPGLFELRNKEIKGFKGKIELLPGVSPVFLKAANPPYALKDRIAKELKEMQEKGTIEYVENSKWASQLVIVHKRDGSLRLCCNYKNTLNPRIKDNKYPLPLIEDLLNALGGFSCFTSLDLSRAYLQLPLDEDSSYYTTVNTHLGLFKFKKLPFGIKTAPALFQSIMDKILHGIPNVVCYFDDILVFASNEQENLRILKLVLKRLEEHNVEINWKKCKFFEKTLEYLGHEISESGIRPSKTKTHAIVNAKIPTDLTSLRSFLGLVNFYGKFVKNLQSLLHPLHTLLKKGEKFLWTKECQEVFDQIKRKLSESPLLVHFNPELPITLNCDASPYGVGSVLNVVVDNEERPCQMCSYTLSKAEQNYSQLHREILAVVTAVKKFHKYIYGRKITVFTDCKPVVNLLTSEKCLGNVINSRFLRWLVFLQNYDLDVKFRPAKKNLVADALSRNPTDDEVNTDNSVLSFENFLGMFNSQVEERVSIEDIVEELARHEFYVKLKSFIKEGWPDKSKIPGLFLPFYKVRDYLDLQEECIFFGDRVFIPEKFKRKTLELIHKDHFGIVNCKFFARNSVWWPQITKDIESFIKNCEVCQSNSKFLSQCPLQPWAKTSFPMERIHIDHFFFNSVSFFVIVDDYSKWIHAEIQRKIDTESVILSLKKFFAIFGLARTLVSDNGPAFKSKQFEVFCKANNVEHVTSPPYHPQSNGSAERAVGVIKISLKKFLADGLKSNQSLENLLQSFLLASHLSLKANGRSPAETLFSYNLISNLPQRPLPNCKKSSMPLPPQSKNGGGDNTQVVSSKMKHFKEGDLVYVYWYPAKRYLKGVVEKRVSAFTYMIQLEDQHIVKIHRECLKERETGFVHSHRFVTSQPEANKSTSQPSTNIESQHNPQPLNNQQSENRKDSLRPLERINYKKYF